MFSIIFFTLFSWHFSEYSRALKFKILVIMDKKKKNCIWYSSFVIILLEFLLICPFSEKLISIILSPCLTEWWIIMSWDYNRHSCQMNCHSISAVDSITIYCADASNWEKEISLIENLITITTQTMHRNHHNWYNNLIQLDS